MINKNNKRNTYKNHTNVTNYNKFLLTLDKQNNNTSKQISISNKTNNDNKINNDTEKNNKREIKQQVNNINSSFRDNFNNPAFTGITPMQEMLFTLEDTIDPNLYVFSPDNSIANKQQHNNIPAVNQNFFRFQMTMGVHFYRSLKRLNLH